MYEHLSREELEARLSASEKVCSLSLEHAKRANPSVWRQIVLSLRSWEALRKEHEGNGEPEG